MSGDRPTAGASGTHLDLTTIADLDEDLLTPGEQSAAENHLADCAVCTEAQRRLVATRDRLAHLPRDPMPDDVAQRLEAALTAAASSTILPLQAPRRRWRSRPTIAGAGAAAAVAALIAAIVVATTVHHSSGPTQASGPAHGRAGLGAAAPAPIPATVSGDLYTKADAARLVTRLVRQPPTPGPRPAAGLAPAVAPALQPLYSDPTALRQCITALTKGGPAQAPVAVDFGRFTDTSRHIRKAPAVVIVLPGLRVGADDAWIVGPNCATAPDNDLFLYQTVPSTP